MAQVTVITGAERRRRWGEDERRKILAAAFSPGAVVADVARRYEVATSLIYKWRRQLVEAHEMAAFVPAVVVGDPPAARPVASSGAAIVVELASGARITIGADAPSSAISAALRALR